jgi:hypothetical protein
VVVGIFISGCFTITFPVDEDIPVRTVWDLPAAITNAIPTTKPATTSCGCDLSKPVAVAPYTDKWLKAQGNHTECPQTKAGAGNVRGPEVSNGAGKWWLLGNTEEHGNILEKAYDVDGKRNACGKCFDADGGRYHFLGYRYNDDPLVLTAPGVWFPYHWVTFIRFEFRVK